MVASVHVDAARRAFRSCALAVLMASIAATAPLPVARADQSKVLEQMLKEGANFRVRVRAAMALGRLRKARYAAALERALWDRHPAVRQAAAVSIRRLGTARSLPALRIAARDTAKSVAREATAAIKAIERKHRSGSRGPAMAAARTSKKSKWGRPRFAVVVGDMRNASGFQGADLATHLGKVLAAGLRENSSIVVIDPYSGTGSIAAARRQRLPVFRMDANLVSVRRSKLHGEISVRCEVSLLLLDEEQRTIRSMLKGAATHSESPRGPRASQERMLARKAIVSAVGSALGNAWQALQKASVLTARPAYAKR